MIGIYKITSPSGRIYIGQTNSIAKRKVQYKGLRCKSQTRLYASLVKYGFCEHIFEVVEECSVEDLNTRERHWQDFYDVLGEKGLNCHLTETAEKTRRVSQETRNRIRDTNRQKGLMPPVREKGYSITQEHKDAIRQAHLEKIPWNKGKSGYSINRIAKNTPCKEDTKNKISDAKSKYREIECISTTGEVVKIYKNMRELVQDGFSRDTVGQCLRGKLSKHRGFFWRIKQKD